MFHFSRRAVGWGCFLLGCSLFAGFPLGAQAQEPDPLLVKLDETVGKFFDGVSRGELTKSYNELLKDSTLAKQTDSIKNLIEKTKELEKNYGKYRGLDRVDAKKIGKDLYLTRYLYKCDEFPVVWYFTFYRDFKRADSDANHWIVVAVRFDTDLDLLNF